MLILSRKKGESIQIGDDIEITIAAIHGDQVKIGINAPKHVEIHRKEVYLDIQEENANAAKNIEGLLHLLAQSKKDSGGAWRRMMDKKIQNQLVQIGLSTEKVKKIILFGSRAVWDNTDRSDIDLAIVAPEMSKEEWVLFALDLEEELDTLLSLDIIKFEDASQPLKSEILKNGKLLYQDDDIPNELEKDNFIESP